MRRSGAGACTTHNRTGGTATCTRAGLRARDSWEVRGGRAGGRADPIGQSLTTWPSSPHAWHRAAGPSSVCTGPYLHEHSMGQRCNPKRHRGRAAGKVPCRAKLHELQAITASQLQLRRTNAFAYVFGATLCLDGPAVCLGAPRTLGHETGGQQLRAVGLQMTCTGGGRVQAF